MKIWAHRGCSQMYPENTLLAFEKAVEIDGLTGIELDVQLTRDGYLAVCHDERVDRTTDGIGELRQYSLAELKKLRIDAGNHTYQQIPLLEEIFDQLQEHLKRGLKLNIELKNSVFPYEGMEKKVIELVHRYGLHPGLFFEILELHHSLNNRPFSDPNFPYSRLFLFIKVKAEHIPCRKMIIFQIAKQLILSPPVILLTMPDF